MDIQIKDVENILKTNNHQIFYIIYQNLIKDNNIDVIEIIKNFEEINGITISNLLFLLRNNNDKDKIIKCILDKIANINFSEYSYILYTVKNFNDEIKLKIFNKLNIKINNFDFIDIKNIKNLFLSLKNIKLDNYFLNKSIIFDKIINNITEKQNDLTPDIISSIFNSLINFNYKNKKVKKLLVLLSYNIKTNKNNNYKMNNIIDIFEGISNMYSTEEEVRNVLIKLHMILLNNKIYWNSCKITKIFSYLKNMCNEYDEVNDIIKILTKKIQNDFYNIKDISYSIQGLKSMKYTKNIGELLIVFHMKIDENYFFDNINFIGIIFNGLIGMNSSYSPVINLIDKLNEKISYFSNISFLDLSNILYGLQNMSNFNNYIIDDIEEPKYDNENSSYTPEYINVNFAKYYIKRKPEECNIIINELLRLLANLCENIILNNNCIQLLGKALYGLLNMNYNENIEKILNAIFSDDNVENLMKDYISYEYSSYTISQLNLFLYKFENHINNEILKKINNIITKLKIYEIKNNNKIFSSCIEKNVFAILKKSYNIENNVIEDGFELDFVITINDIKLNIEIDGPIHKYPKKELFNRHKKEYLENKKNYLVLHLDDYNNMNDYSDNLFDDYSNDLLNYINKKIYEELNYKNNTNLQ
jgi:hypothetical protein